MVGAGAEAQGERSAWRVPSPPGVRTHWSPSTVKTHLERIYAKLGISGRAALATELTRHESVHD
jgi:hypothetical protein